MSLLFPIVSFQSIKLEFDIFNREFFRTLMFSLKFQKKAQVSIIYMKNIVFLLPSCTTGTLNNYPTKLRLKVKFFWSDTNDVVGSKLSFK
jgi:hypothetical protein